MPKEQSNYDRMRKQGSGPSYEPNITANDWAKANGYDPVTRTYRREDEDDA